MTSYGSAERAVAAAVNRFGQLDILVHNASFASCLGCPGITPYAVSKGAVEQSTRLLALKVASMGIRVNAVGAGNVVANLFDTLRDDGPEFSAEHGSRAPMGRAAEPHEIAEVVIFPAPDRTSFATESIFKVNGG